MKVALGNPVIFVTGDFNHRDVGPTLSLATNLCLTPTGPTRGANTLDLIYSNINELKGEVGVLPALDNEAGGRSYHKCVFI